MRKFALYTEPKTAAEVAQMYRVFQEGDGNSDCLTAKQSGVVGKVICDATTKGGGWTLLAKIADKGNACACSTAPSGSPFSSYATQLDHRTECEN